MKPRPPAAAALVAVALLLAPGLAPGSGALAVFTNLAQTKLTLTGGAPGDEFHVTAVDGTTAIVGAYYQATAAGIYAGAAYVFVRSGSAWTLQAMLTASDGGPVHAFGVAVAIQGDRAVVGAPRANAPGANDAGAVYVFDRTGSSWTETAKLTANDAAAGDGFGSAIDISGPRIAVGAYRDDNLAGAAYMFFDSPGWPQQKLTARDPAAGDLYGNSVAIDGDSLVVGNPLDDTGAGPNAGSVYVYTRVGSVWTWQAWLTATDGRAGDALGIDVDLDGDTILAGAYNDDSAALTDAGSAYVFQRAGGAWSQQAKLTPGDPEFAEEFGVSVQVEGDTAVVGARLDDTPGGTDSGSAYAFQRVAGLWLQLAKLTPGDGAASDYFGSAVALSGDVIVVGSRFDDTLGGTDAGSATVFARTGLLWGEQARLRPTGGNADDRMGGSVGVSGDTVVVGAYSDDDTSAGPNAGTASVFVRSGSGWADQAILRAGDAAANDQFGEDVAIDGDTIVVGAPLADLPGLPNAGAAYVFVRSGTSWSQQAKLVAGDAAGGDEFGISVALRGDTVLVGARRDDNAGGTDAGAAYVFVRSGGSWTPQTKLVAMDPSTDDSYGRSVALADDLTGRGNIAVVGSPQDNTGTGSDTGSAYVYRRTGTAWVQAAWLTAFDAAASDYFGDAVAADNGTIAIGSYAHDTSAGTNAGQVYMYTTSGSFVTFQSIVTASDAGANDLFGVSLAVSGGTLLVGAYVDDTGAGSDAGSAYAFTSLGARWVETTKLTAADAAPGDWFGWAVAVSGDLAVVGAVLDDTGTGGDAGSAYVFDGVGA